MALLKIAESGDASFDSVRIAPLYDAVTTRVFPQLENDHMALKLAEKDDRLKRADFLKLAATGGINASATVEAMDALLAGFEEGLNAVSLPSELQFGDINIAKAEQMLTLCRDRLKQFLQD